MRRVAVFADAGYFWVQVANAVFGAKSPRSAVKLDYERLRNTLLAEVAAQFPGIDLLRVYWYDGPSQNGQKTVHHHCIDKLDDFKLRLGTRNGAGQQKAVDGLIIADMLGLAQARAITDALLISGDADMTPGLVAAQNLGLKVHLLIMGPSSATSPQLAAEADRKFSWSAKIIESFAEPAPPVDRVPADAVATSVQPFIAAPIAADIAFATKPEPTESAALDWAAIAKKAHNGISASGHATTLTSLTRTAIQLPKIIHVALLRTGAATVKRSLQEAEKRQLRSEFKKLL
ncbi:hypothetical protein C9I57_08610 [Trinickia symbiotica]|uniref:NYN domain-containing protein n=1 Tax=Trinickia symbiotica TaxID=863227 RepID=A0A2T3XWD1_9BURK|nr:NYN domain-containing protein [Trinickia symbiotica]PTB20805.1 hypothetical protein C9I57_08610 [Trinickia symbiotica]